MRGNPTHSAVYRTGSEVHLKLSSSGTGKAEQWEDSLRDRHRTPAQCILVQILGKPGFRERSTCWIQNGGPKFLCFMNWVIFRTWEFVEGHTVWILLVAILTYEEVTMLEKRETITAFHKRGKEGYPWLHTPMLGQEDNGSLTADANT